MGSFSASAAYSRNAPCAAADTRRWEAPGSPSARPARRSKGPESAPPCRRAEIAHLTANPVAVGSACRVALIVTVRAPPYAPQRGILRRAQGRDKAKPEVRRRNVKSNSNSRPVHRHFNKWRVDLKLVGNG
jgi:hypothetical protein